MREIHTTTTSASWVGETPTSFLPVCHFPFHALGFREGKIFKPKKVTEGRALCWYSPPMHFAHRSRVICGVEETKLTITAQIAMLNHANVLTVAKAPTGKTSKAAHLSFTGYTEENRVEIKARGVALLKEFLAAPAASRIPLSAGLVRVANGTVSDAVSEASEAASEAEAEMLEPMPLPGVGVDTFDDDGEDFE